MMKFLVTLHVLAAVIWVGGMFFAYMFQRTAAAQTLEPPQRLPLWVATFKGFFPWVWGCIAVILVTGLSIIFGVYGGFGSTPVFVHIMFMLGLVMMAIFMHMFFAPFKRLKAAVAAQDWPAGGAQLNQIRRIVGINTIIGFITIITATAGCYFMA